MKQHKKEYEVRKKDQILTFSFIAIFVILLLETIIRKIIFIVLYDHGWLEVQAFNRDFLWLGYIFGSLFFLAVVPAIYGFVTTSQEFQLVIQSYGTIPLRIRKRRVEDQVLIAKAEPKPIIETIILKPEEEKILQCKKCGT